MPTRARAHLRMHALHRAQELDRRRSDIAPGAWMRALAAADGGHRLRLALRRAGAGHLDIWWSRRPLIEVVLSTHAVRLGFIGRSGPEHRRYPAESRRSRDGIRWYSVWSGSGHAGMARGGDCPLLSRRFGVDFADDGFLRPSRPECMLQGTPRWHKVCLNATPRSIPY